MRREPMHMDTALEMVIKIVIYLALFFGCILCLLEKFMAGQFLLMVAWIGFIGVAITSKIERLMQNIGSDTRKEREP